MKKRLVVSALVIALAATLLAAGTGSGFAADADYPKKPVTLICQFSAGGSTDLLGRALAQSASKYLGQPIVVENKPGASGTIGTDYVLKSLPDGYTLLTTSTGNFTSTPLIQNVPYDPVKDVTHIINIARHPIILVVNGESPWKTVEEFVAYVKANPGKVKYGQNAPGGTTHMAMEAFRKQAKLDMKMVPYGGGASEVVTALLGKHVDVGVVHPQEGKEFLAAGKLKALVIFSKKRAKALADVPTAIEKGYNVDIGVTKGISGPAGLPEDITRKLHDAFRKTMDDKDFLAAAKNTGDLDYLDYMDGKEITAFLVGMHNELRPIIGELGLSKKK